VRVLVVIEDAAVHDGDQMRAGDLGVPHDVPGAEVEEDRPLTRRE
jgi:hypothetical protein